MKSVTELRETLNQRIANTRRERLSVERVLVALEEHELEAASLVVFNTCTRIYWYNGFNAEHEASITCEDNRIFGRTYTRSGSESKQWLIEGPGQEEIQMPMAESIEYIRHYIWANHEST